MELAPSQYNLGEPFKRLHDAIFFHCATIINEDILIESGTEVLYMASISSIVSDVLFFVVGLICIAMAKGSLFSNQLLPFYEKAINKTWNEIEKNTQYLILSFVRFIGFGFLVIGLLLLSYPFIMFFYPNIIYKYVIPGLSLVFLAGLLYSHFYLYKMTKSATHWKESVSVIVLLGIGIIVSIL